MAQEIILPALSAGMTEAVIARWLKSHGELVRKGDAIAEVETDKATMELEAQADGYLAGIAFDSGATVPVNSIVGFIVQKGDDLLVEGRRGSQAKVREQPERPTKRQSDMGGQAASSQITGVNESGKLRASPLAKRIAAQRGIDLATVTGTGPGGRIVRIDVEGILKPERPAIAIETPTPGLSLSDHRPHISIPHSMMRRAIARRLLEAKTTVPHFYLHAECRMEPLLALRTEINVSRPADQRISVNDFIVKAAASALQAHPKANVVWTDQALLQFSEVDISVAVATDGGLITPIIREANHKGLGVISEEVRDLASRAREGQLRPSEYQGGSFSISNLGMYGVSSFTAIINPPQSAILAVGAIERRPVVDGDHVSSAELLMCTLSLDHRCIDGALGAQLLASFKEAVESPLRLLV
ncbi:MAG: pyruvate dehydrogenase complex dihydrolipoamide acetyltransferase [Mesorhizobium sp.]|uniref:pyruvate dehydrogenase complex dihydrolipoamide acetyltransferase n=1 Tax=Mesorhizobium sp. TaxID=1871066 RepID=UPI000FE8A736|nr:pyruvate dehydrogenase complex dihydrolipoamide acetyltransferase [Mesorhizobium sp.]RWE22877.1 MAG: pyruvate dehydrogenase complex dihydrolipoamide acetyltransferase [Mesorhizobium sp.]